MDRALSTTRLLGTCIAAALLLGGCAPHGVDAPVSPTRDAALRAEGIGSHRIRVGDTELHYLSAGTPGRKLVLFLHGFPESSLAWKDYFPAFSDEYYVVAPDLRGFGESTVYGAVRAYEWERLVEDIHGLVTGLGYRQAYVVGHDWGGSVGWLLAIQSPELVEKLVVFNSPHPYIFNALYTDTRSEQHQLFWHYRAFQTDAITADTLRANDAGLLKVFAFSQRSATPEEIASSVEQWRRPGVVEAMIDYYKALSFTEIPSWIPDFVVRGIRRKFHVKVPVLVLWGEQDTALSVENLRGVEAFVPKLTIARFPNANHWSNHQLFPEIVPTLKGFLARADDARPAP